MRSVSAAPRVADPAAGCDAGGPPGAATGHRFPAAVGGAGHGACGSGTDDRRGIVRGKVRSQAKGAPVGSRSLVAVAVIAGLLSGGGTAGAATRQDASPILPDAAECTVEPRSRGDLRRLAGRAFDAASTPATPTPSTDPAPPTGEPAAPAVVEAVERTLHLFYACQNAENLAALFSLLTDDVAVAFFEPGLRAAQEVTARQGAATPAGLPSGVERAVVVESAVRFVERFGEITPERTGREGYVALRDVVVLEDGRVGGRLEAITIAGSGQEYPETTSVFFRREGARYLIDGFADVGAEATPAATPAS